MKNKQIVTEQTRNNFFEAFWNLYKTKDLNKISVSEICKKANYDRTTFYRYFFDIDDILNQLENSIIENLKSGIKKNIDSLTFLPFDKFELFNELYGEYIIVFYDKGNRSFYNKFKNMIKNNVYEYLNLKVKDENKKEFLYEFIFSSLIISYAYWYKNQSLMNIKTFAKVVNNMIIHGFKIVINDMNDI